MSGDVVVVGAGLGGLRVVEELRRQGCGDRISLVGAERHPPYDRPPLTKQVLRGERDETPLRDELGSLDVTVLLEHTATRLDTVDRTVHLDDGRALHYGCAVLAPGGRARTLPHVRPRPGLHVVRSIDDALALRAAALRSGSVVVVGGGFIGCEVSASLRTLGVTVDLVELLPLPLGRVLGPVGGQIVADLLAAGGVTLHCGVGVEEVTGTGHVDGVTLSGGVHIPTSEVVVGLGIAPEVDWLHGSGVAVEDGILCDAVGRTSAPDVYAVGDAANWHQPLLGRRHRLEHWTTTGAQARTVACAITGTGIELADVPYFWSDLFDVKIQALGFVDPADDVRAITVGGGRTVLLYARDGILRGAVGFSAGRWVMRLRALIADRGSSESADRLLTS